LSVRLGSAVSCLLVGAALALPAADVTRAQVTGAQAVAPEPDVVRTFYLSHADVKEVVDALRLLLDARRVVFTSVARAITIRDTAAHVAAAARIIAAIDKEQPEIFVDLELLEVDRSALLEYGLQVASPGSPGVDGVVAPIDPAAAQTGTLSLRSLGSLGPSQLAVANLPALNYRLLRSNADTRTLANPQLSTVDGSTAQVRIGDRVPVPVTTLVPAAASGASPSQPIASYDYRDIGLNVDVTPRVHDDSSVTLALKVNISAIETATGFGGLPEFSNREVGTMIDLHDGETSVVAGLVRDDETRLVEGIPGMGDLPALGHLFSHRQTSASRTDVILTLTPHVIRNLDLSGLDVSAFPVRDGAGAVPPASAPAPPSPLLRRPPAGAPTGFAGDLTGTWTGTIASIPGAPEMIWTLSQTGATVTGSVSIGYQGLSILAGTLSGAVAGGTLTYSIQVPVGGLSLAPDCSGVVAGSATAAASTISGSATPGISSCTLPISTVSFVLQRR
jgi:general secretion pathway protein D